MRHIARIILHCSATRADWRDGQKTETKIKEVTRWHVEDNGWSDNGYQFMIDRTGPAVACRPIERMGAGVRGENDDSIHICLFGGHGGASTDQFADHFTTDQQAALVELIADLTERFGPLEVSGHNDYAAKACPCFDAKEWTQQFNPAQKAKSVMEPANATHRPHRRRRFRQ